jgi:S1-C subfamily serine protease
MRAPKHLWAGDWERASAAVSEELAALEELPRLVDTVDKPSPEQREPAAAPPRRARRRLDALRILLPSPIVRRIVAIGFVVLIALAAGAYGLGSLVRPVRPVRTRPRPSPAVASGPMYWLGVEVETLTPGLVLIATVARGSPGERAGLEPGDVIFAIANQPIDVTGDIAKATGGMHRGERVPVEISRGSTVYTTSVAVGAAPTSYP